MKFLFTLVISLFIHFQSFSQQDDYIIWNKKMKNSVYLKEMLKVIEQSKIKLENNYYGNDLQLLDKIDKNCFKSETDLTNCLKAVGFKKAQEYSKSTFLWAFYWSKFLKQNPGFYDLERGLRF